MNSILALLSDLGPDWHDWLAGKITAPERVRIFGALESRPMPNEPFTLIVADRDENTFSVEGPMVDDNLWSDAVVGAQNLGRQVRCHVPGEASAIERRRGSQTPNRRRPAAENRHWSPKGLQKTVEMGIGQ